MQERNTDVDEGGGQALGRPLTARSVVASVLLGMRTPELSGQRLVRTAELFGLAEGTTRVALSRMVSSGELVASEGRYRLAGALLDRQARQQGSRRPALTDWDGAWVVAVVERAGPRPPGARVELRRALVAARLAEWREGVWARPANLVMGEGDPACTWLAARLGDRAAGKGLAERLWDLDGWKARADRLRERMSSTIGDLEARHTDALAPCFITAAAVVRQIHNDPLLPGDLLPPRWPGQSLRAEYDRYEEAYQALLRAFLTGLDR
jgi:phenylacetic acid degradation operon negative regulatory protein